MLVSFIYVGNLDRFLQHLKTARFDVEEYAHTVLTDSSEFEMVICRKDGINIAYMMVHYIDTHYAVLSNLRPDAEDKELLEVLMSVDKRRLWRVPVEPIIYVTNSYEFIRTLHRYVDEVPEEGRNYLEKYLRSNDSIKNVVEVDILLSIASRFRGSENYG